MDHEKLVKAVIENVGGADNVENLVHCVTRLRFTLSDVNKADKKALERIPGVLGTTYNGGQYQVIVGQEAPNYYKEAIQFLPNVSSETGKSTEEGKQQNVLLRMLNALSSCMTPVVPALAGSGILKVILSVLTMTGLLTVEENTYVILAFFADAVFYFLPMMLAVSAANKFKVNVYLALSIAGIMLHPNFIAMVAAKEPISFFGVSVTLINYSSTVIPIIILVWMMSYFERFADKISPSIIKVFFKPLLVTIITAPIALIVVGPLGYYLGDGLARGIYFLQEHMGWLALAILSGFKPILVMTGMHWAFTPAIITSLATYGYDGLMAVSSLSAVFTLTGVSLAVALKTKNKGTRQIALSSGITSLLSGITEPALYGVAVKFKRAMITVVISGFVSGTFAGLMKVKVFALVAPGLLKFPSFISSDYPSNFMNATITALIAFGLSFSILWFWGIEEESQPEDTAVKEKDAIFRSELGKTIMISSPVSGRTRPLSEVHDKVFAEELMGKGIAIVPSEGLIVSPVDGRISMVSESSHAIGVISENGTEILIHVGLDTVKLEGKYFEPLVKARDTVSVGQPLLQFDLEQIKNAGYDIVTPVIITNTADYTEVVSVKEKDIKVGEKIIGVI